MTSSRSRSPGRSTSSGGRPAPPAPPAPPALARDAERNWLLTALTADEYDATSPYFETVSLGASQRLGPPHEEIPYVYFPQSGVVSILKRMDDATEVEVGTVGAEGMSGLAVFLGGDEMPTECVVQIAGAARRVTAANLQALSRQGAPLYDVLRCYTQYVISQMAQAVACDRLHSLEQRFARWLLMTYDRVGDRQFALTHEHLASLLGVRRAGVSVAAESFQRSGAITYSRGTMRILDHTRLEAAACECYAATRAEFDRLLGSAGRHGPPPPPWRMK